MRNLDVMIMAPDSDTPARSLTIQVDDENTVGPALLIQRGHHVEADNRYFVRREFTRLYDEVDPYYIKRETGR